MRIVTKQTVWRHSYLTDRMANTCHSILSNWYCICAYERGQWIFILSHSAGDRFTFTRTNTKPPTIRTAYETNDDNRCCVNVYRLNAEVRKKRPYDKCIACHVTVCVAHEWYTFCVVVSFALPYPIDWRWHSIDCFHSFCMSFVFFLILCLCVWM